MPNEFETTMPGLCFPGIRKKANLAVHPLSGTRACHSYCGTHTKQLVGKGGKQRQQELVMLGECPALAFVDDLDHPDHLRN